MNIVLIGYRCSGKTEVGKILAKELNKDFFDTDKLIEDSAGCSIEKIIYRYGWEYFRNIEKKIIEKVSTRDDLILATGGGIVLEWDNVINLQRNGLIVWLDGNAEVLKERMKRDHGSGKIRPSLTGSDPLDEIREVLTIRKPLYERAADLVVDAGSASIHEVTNSIINALSKEIQG
ncbi:MAG: shikimate kinase [Thermodesulfobacteriota bacterium]|nr:shikimate kinase [Thermodesulfobacteriota bacterium]